jgi:hypothetical protein
MMQVRPGITWLWHQSRVPRPRRWWLAVLAALVAITTMASLGSGGAASAAPAGSAAPDVPNVTVYLTNASSYCLDVKDSVNSAGTAIWLYKCSGGKSEHWYEFGGVECGNGGEYICSYFEDTRNENVCLGMNGSRDVVLQGCGPNGADYTSSELWIEDTGTEDGWRNFAWGPNGDLAVASDKQGDLLYGTDASAGCGGCWFRWTDS